MVGMACLGPLERQTSHGASLGHRQLQKAHQRRSQGLAVACGKGHPTSFIHELGGSPSAGAHHRDTPCHGLEGDRAYGFRGAGHGKGIQDVIKGKRVIRF